jgi:hypothetical protein
MKGLSRYRSAILANGFDMVFRHPLNIPPYLPCQGVSAVRSFDQNLSKFNIRLETGVFSTTLAFNALF